jgi:predicted RNA-binding Zn ribbon-like protein
MSNGLSGNIERLTKVLGFDPAKASGGNVFSEALNEVQKKRTEATKAKAMELIESAIKLREEMDGLERQFGGQKKKFEKELGKVLNRIESMARGLSPSQAEAQEKEAESQSDKSED